MTRRGQVAASVLVLWAAGLVLLARRELFRPRSAIMAEAALRVVPGASFYAVTQGDRQIGFASSTVDTAPQQITLTDYMVADLPVGGSVHRATARSSVVMTRGMRARSFSFSLDSDGGLVRASGTIDGDSVITVAIGADSARPDTQRIHIDGPVFLPTLLPLALTLGERPRVGRSSDFPTFDPATMTTHTLSVAVRAESLFVLHDSATFDSVAQRWVPLLPDTVRAWQMVPDGASSFFTGWVDDEGRIVAGTARQLGGIALRREPYELAFDNWRLSEEHNPQLVPADRDILETTAIAAGKALRGSRLDRLVVRLTDADLSGFDLAGGRQRLSGDTLTVTREDSSALHAAWRIPADRHRFATELAAEPLVQVGNPRIAFLAMRIAGSDRDPRVLAGKLEQWVHDSIRNVTTFGIPSALQVLDSRRGDCNEHTQLYLALARTLGIPTRAAAGLAYVDGKFYYHAWPEVWLNGWVAVDPTFGQFPADAGHLRFVVGGLGRQAELLRLIGNLKIDVLASR